MSLGRKDAGESRKVGTTTLNSTVGKNCGSQRKEEKSQKEAMGKDKKTSVGKKERVRQEKMNGERKTSFEEEKNGGEQWEKVTQKSSSLRT